jgi:cystathionine beta-lyase
MNYDFTTPVSRLGTGSMKWDRYRDRDVLPFWVADMDFVSAPEIVAALRERANHGIFGYTVPTLEVEEAVLEYLHHRHGLEAQVEWIVWLPGLVQGINLCCRAFGPEVMTLTPIYPPFRSAPSFAEGVLREVELQRGAEQWEIDWDAMKRNVTPQTSLLLWCHPHNPVGKVFSREEMGRVLEFCAEHSLVLCSDEIHCDLILDDVPHVPALSLEGAAAHTITLLSPSKTYNLPGLACAYAVIPNPELRHRFRRICRGIITEINCFGYVGCHAAYRHGEPWRRELIEVLRNNRDRVFAFMADKFPEVPMTPMAATYLAWLDVRPLGLEDPVTQFERAGIGLSDGKDFGRPGQVRLNFGCPAAQLEEGLRRFAAAVDR